MRILAYTCTSYLDFTRCSQGNAGLLYCLMLRNKTIGESRSRGSSRCSAGAPVFSKLCLSTRGPIAAVHILYVGFRHRGASFLSVVVNVVVPRRSMSVVTGEASRSMYTDRTSAWFKV